jgi:DNA-binding CsgD family transcriptional regulator
LAATAQRIVGREDELARLERVLDGLVERPGPRLIEISGEPGIGKTRLLDELCERAERREYLVLRGMVAEFERGVPFAPVVDALDPYLGTLDPKRLRLPEGELRDELGAIFPSLRTERTPLTGVHDERYRAYRAVRELLERLAAARPLVVAIDDIQWADDASAELIAALLQKPPRARVALALARRSGQGPSALTVALGTVERRRGAHRLRLGPLTANDVDRLHGGRLEPRLRRWVYEVSGGNPFYMDQLVRTAADPDIGSGPAPELAELELPPAISAALAEEIRSLPAEHLALLEAAAVAGERFEPDLVADIAGVTERDVLPTLDELLARELVRPTETPRRFAFRHPIVWKAVYERTKAGWRLAAHQAAADALAARGAPAPERALHVEHAAGRGDLEAAGVLREASAEILHRVPASSAGWLRAALRLLPDGAEYDADRRALLVELASALRGSGDLGGAREALRDALDLLPADDVAGRARLDAACATVESWLGRSDDARRRLRRARAAVGDACPPEAVRLDVRLALEALHELDFKGGAELAAGALVEARELDVPALVAEAAAALALAHGLSGDVPDARERRAEAVAALEGLDELMLADRIEIFFYLGWAETYIEELESALATANRGIELSRATGQGHLIVPLMLTRSLPLDALGRLEESIAVGEEAIEAARASQNPQYLFWALWECAYSHAMAGNVERALELCEESTERSRGLAPNFLFWSQPGSTYGHVLRESGEPERGLEIEIEALGGMDMPRISAYERVIALQQCTEAFVIVGRVDEAAELADRTEAEAERIDLPLTHALAAQGRAAVLLARGDAAEAARVAGDAWMPTLARGLRLDAAHLRRFQGRALAELGDRDAAVSVLRDAEREFDSFPSVRARDEVRRELRKLGARVEPRRATGRDAAEGVASLSSREREIAELVTDRRTNKEIAAELFLSEKTIESHLRNVFAKLGVRSRVQVARVMERERADAP